MRPYDKPDFLPMPFPLQVFRDAKTNRSPIAMVSLYDAPTAALCCDAGVDILLVGDSMGNTILGLDNTVAVSMSDIAHHTEAVARGVRSSQRPQVPVVADLPFGSYATKKLAARNGAKLMRRGAHCVKLEGAGQSALEAVRVLIEMGAPVMGHIGYTPQSALHFAGALQGKTALDAARLLDEAKALESAGCCALLLEMMPYEVAQRITREMAIATVGIGAGASCDGQVLVWHDLTGLSLGKPFRFAKRYAEARELLLQAAREFVGEVHESEFPTAQHGWQMTESERELWRDSDSNDGA